MLLQSTGRHVIAGGFFNGFLHDRRFMFAKSHEHNATRIENRSHSHGDRLPHHVPLPKEVTGRIRPRHTIERDQSRATGNRTARFIKANVAGASDAENLQVDAPSFTNLLFVAQTRRRHILSRQRASGYVDGVERNIDMIKEVLPHEAMVALQRVGRDGPVFVKIECDHACKRQAFLAMQANEFVVDAHRRAACGQSQHCFLTDRCA